jgi:hypothetical protein
VKRTGRGETIGAIIHIYIRTTQGNSLCIYLYLELAKPMFLILSFMFFLLQNQKTGGRGGERVGTGRRGEVEKKGVGG